MPGDERKQRLYCYCIQFNGSSVISSLLNCKLNDKCVCCNGGSVGYSVCLYDLYHCRMEPLITKSFGNSTLCKRTVMKRACCVWESYISVVMPLIELAEFKAAIWEVQNSTEGRLSNYIFIGGDWDQPVFSWGSARSRLKRNSEFMSIKSDGSPPLKMQMNVRFITASHFNECYRDWALQIQAAVLLLQTLN